MCVSAGRSRHALAPGVKNSKTYKQLKYLISVGSAVPNARFSTRERSPGPYLRAKGEILAPRVIIFLALWKTENCFSEKWLFLLYIALLFGRRRSVPGFQRSCAVSFTAIDNKTEHKERADEKTRKREKNNRSTHFIFIPYKFPVATTRGRQREVDETKDTLARDLFLGAPRARDVERHSFGPGAEMHRTLNRAQWPLMDEARISRMIPFFARSPRRHPLSFVTQPACGPERKSDPLFLLKNFDLCIYNMFFFLL